MSQTVSGRISANLFKEIQLPPYLPHLSSPEVLKMGLIPLADSQWIETDRQLPLFHRHKLAQRECLGERVYRASSDSMPAQRELSALLARYLCGQQAEHYALDGNQMNCTSGGFTTPLETDEPLWNCSLWVADDLAIMQERDGRYCLTAASLCSPSEWLLEDKFGRPMSSIHDRVPGLNNSIRDSIDRFFGHLKSALPVYRLNWALQVGDALNQRHEFIEDARTDSPIYYRCERQSLRRLPQSGAIVFTIRVYLHRLESLLQFPGALGKLFAAIDALPEELAHYKRLDELAPALARYRELATDADNSLQL